MDFLRNNFQQIRQMLGGLSRSARLAVALLAVVVALVVTWLVLYGASPEMVPVLNAPLADTALGQASHAVARQGIKAQVRDGRIFVPADRKEAAYAALAFENLLPADTMSDFEALVAKSDIWTTDTQANRQWKLAKEQTLARLIRRFPGVRDAQVLLEPGNPGGLGSRAIPPSASVTVTMQPGQEMHQKLVAGVADLVAGAQPPMKRGDVRIVVNGRPRRAQEEDGQGSDRLERQVEAESYYSAKLLDSLRFIPNVIVSVHVVPDPKREERVVETRYDPDGVVEAVTHSMTDRSSGGAASVGGEPGVATNTGGGRILEPGAATSSRNISEERIEPRFSSVQREGLYGGEVAKDVFASINVPRSYLASVWESLPEDEKPAGTTFIAWMDERLSAIKQQVMGGIGIGGLQQEKVAVGWYFDIAEPRGGAVAQAGVGTLVLDYGKPAAVGALAVMALLMVLMFVRRRLPMPPTVETTQPLGGLLDATIGSVDSEDGALPGVELDEDTVRAQKVVEQVAGMVKGNPDAAATLVKRWIHKK